MEEWQEGIEQNMSDTEVGGTNHIFSASGDIVSCIRVSKGVLHRGKTALAREAMWEPFKHTRPQDGNMQKQSDVGAFIIN